MNLVKNTATAQDLPGAARTKLKPKARSRFGHAHALAIGICIEAAEGPHVLAQPKQLCGRAKLLCKRRIFRERLFAHQLADVGRLTQVDMAFTDLFGSPPREQHTTPRVAHHVRDEGGLVEVDDRELHPRRRRRHEDEGRRRGRPEPDCRGCARAQVRIDDRHSRLERAAEGAGRGSWG